MFGRWWTALRETGRPGTGDAPLSADYRLDAGSLTDIGCYRPTNQDYIGFVRSADHTELLAIVADGMGGHRAGEVASRLAVETVQQRYPLLRNKRKPAAALEKAFAAANQAVYGAAQEVPEHGGMGTTLVALALERGQGYYANVGDSRLYRIANGLCVQLSRDHTLVAELLNDGVISAEQARNHPDQNIVTRAVGTHSTLTVDRCSAPLRLVPDDAFVLCSDGLYGFVEENEIADAVERLSAQEACRSLVETAKQRGGLDNISIIVVRVKGDSSLKAAVPATRS